MKEPIITFLTEAEKIEFNRLTEKLMNSKAGEMTVTEMLCLKKLQDRKSAYLTAVIKLTDGVTSDLILQ